MKKLLKAAFPAAHFRFQVPMGNYIVDFASHRAKLIIEVDGDSHAHQQEYDAARTKFLEGEGYKVIRFWNQDALHNPEGISVLIEKALPPCGEGLGWGPEAAASAKKLNPALRCKAAPTSRPPHRGEEAICQSAIGVF